MADHVELSEEAARLLDAILFSEPQVQPEGPGEVSPSKLARYALGWTDEVETDEIVEWLVGHPSDRKRYVEMRRQIQEGQIVDGALQQELRTELEPVKAFPRARWSFEELKQSAAREGRILQSVLAAMGRRMSRMSVPFSAMRGGVAAEPVSRGDWVTSAVVESGGELIVTAQLERPSSGLRRVSLCYEDPLFGSIVLAETLTSDERWELTIDGFGQLFAISAGPLGTARLIVSEAKGAELSAPQWVIAVQHSDREESWLTIPRLSDPILDESGRFVLPLELSPSITYSYAGYRLSAFLSMQPEPLLLAQEPLERVFDAGQISGPFGVFSGHLPAEAITLILRPASWRDSYSPGGQGE